MSRFSEHRVVQKYQADECTTEEELMIENYINFTHTTIQNLKGMKPYLNRFYSNYVGPLVDSIETKMTVWITNVRAGEAAASILILLGLRALFLALSNYDLQTEKVNDFDSGLNKSTMTLADRRTNLNYVVNGLLLRQFGIEVLKMKVNALVYSVVAPRLVFSAYNIITTIKGGQYKVVSLDNTNVWRNSASSLSCQTFSTGVRVDGKVNLLGDVYFEVTVLDRKPFILKIDKQNEVVVGTQFNVNSYVDERVNELTYLAGAIRDSSSHAEKGGVILKLNDQVINNGVEIRVERIYTSLANTSKKQEIVYQNENLQRHFAERQVDVYRKIVYENSDVGKEMFGKKNLNMIESRKSCMRWKTPAMLVEFEVRKILITNQRRS